MPEWKDDDALFELMLSTLRTPVVGDVLDQQANYHQFLPPAVRPLRDTMKVAGRAMPVLQTDVFGPQDQPFGRLTEALDDLRPGEVYVATGGDKRCANWGEIMTAAAKKRGAVGAVVHGFHRDTPAVLAQRFSVFSHGPFGQDSEPRMKVADFRCLIEIGGVPVRPGDIVFGDVDGVVIIPKELEESVIIAALAKARTEKVVRKEIENGMSSTEAFRRYGVL